jgi:hypothetical protein
VLLFDSEMLLDINQLCRLRHFMLYWNLMSWTHIITIFFMNEASACCHLHHICWLMAIFAGLHSGLSGCGCCTACSSSQNTLELSVPCTAVVFHSLTHVSTLYCCHRRCHLLVDSRPLACDLLCFFTLNTVKTDKVLGLLLFSVMFLCPRCCGMLFILVLLSCNFSSSLLDCHTCKGIRKKNWLFQLVYMHFYPSGKVLCGW